MHRRAAVLRRLTTVLCEARADLPVLLDATLTPAGGVDLIRFDEFRHRLLRLIAIEERVLMPALAAKLGHSPTFQKGMRKDHEGLVTLCVATPNAEWVENLRQLLTLHLELESRPDGLLALVEAHLLEERPLLDAIAALPPLQLPAFDEGASVREVLRRVLRETGLTTAEPSVSA